jgi:hypothetical protein
MYRPLTDWVNKKLDATKAPLRSADLVDEAIDRFRRDPNFLANEFRTFLLGEIRAILAQTRGPIILPTHLGTRVISNSEVLTSSPVVRWREQTAKGHMLLTEMRRPDLTEAIGYRRHAHQALGRRLLFLEAIRRGLPDDKQTVGERYEAEQLEALRRRYEQGTGEIDDKAAAAAAAKIAAGKKK